MTETGVRRIQQLVRWWAPSRPVDWTAIVRLLGVRMPQGFQELVEAFPYGDFQYDIRLFHPDRWGDLAAYREGIVNNADDFRSAAEDIGLKMYPDDGGLIPWATIGGERMLCWRPDAGDPDMWPTVICDWSSPVWNTFEMSTSAFLATVLTDPPVIAELAEVTRIVQPPHFTPYATIEGSQRGPTPDYWTAGIDGALLIEPRFALEELAFHVQPAPIPGFDYNAMTASLEAAFPPDHEAVLTAFGGVSIGPATVLVPNESDCGLRAEQAALAARIKVLRDVGAGPAGTVAPEHRGLVLWGKLDDGGYLCWARISSDYLDWPVVVLDASLNRHATYRMSMSRFLLELATNPDGIVLPSA